MGVLSGERRDGRLERNDSVGVARRDGRGISPLERAGVPMAHSPKRRRPSQLSEAERYAESRQLHAERLEADRVFAEIIAAHLRNLEDDGQHPDYWH
jgi:hypothetical protein